MNTYNLDVISPTDLPRVLRAAADAYRASTADLQATWQDDDAGKVWMELARVLDRAADAADKAIARHF